MWVWCTFQKRQCRESVTNISEEHSSWRPGPLSCLPSPVTRRQNMFHLHPQGDGHRVSHLFSVAPFWLLRYTLYFMHMILYSKKLSSKHVHSPRSFPSLGRQLLATENVGCVVDGKKSKFFITDQSTPSYTVRLLYMVLLSVDVTTIMIPVQWWLMVVSFPRQDI